MFTKTDPSASLCLSRRSMFPKRGPITNAERVRTPGRGEIVVLRNVDGFYAALQILGIKDDTRGADRDELRFRYAIQANGTDTFTSFDSNDIT